MEDMTDGGYDFLGAVSLNIRGSFFSATHTKKIVNLPIYLLKALMKRLPGICSYMTSIEK